MVLGGRQRANQRLQTRSLITCRSLRVCQVSSSTTAHGRVMTTFVGSAASGLVTQRKQCLLFAQHSLQKDWLTYLRATHGVCE